MSHLPGHRARPYKLMSTSTDEEHSVEIDNLRAEIADLESSLPLLKSKNDSLLRDIAQFEHDHRNRNISKPPNLSASRPQEEPSPSDDIPPLILESYFDSLIKKYFSASLSNSSPSNDQAPTPPPQSLHESALAILKHTSNSHLALIESIYRLTGVTAFPISDKLYDTSADALLGLRFDVLCHRTNRFLTPHYIILRRVQSKSHHYDWLVFRYTTPAFVPLDSLHTLLHNANEEKGVRRFAFAVRDCLLSVQYKHDKFAHLAAMTEQQFGIASHSPAVCPLSIDCDLEARRVVIELPARGAKSAKSPPSISLLCGVSCIEDVSCTLVSGAARSYIEGALVNCRIRSLTLTFSHILRHLDSHHLL